MQLSNRKLIDRLLIPASGHLPDFKTGSKTLYLGSAARDLLAALPRSHDDWVFLDRDGSNPAEIDEARWTRTAPSRLE